MKKNYIFGYGSLVGACGVNGRRMRKQYRPKDLTETYLRDYTRHLEAGPAGSGVNYYGVDKDPDGLVNGVLFEINTEDRDPFLISEGFGLPERIRPYKMVDVTNKITTKVNGRVWVCECTRRNDGEVQRGYFWRVAEALKERSKKFNKEFAPFDLNWQKRVDFFEMWD